jgi:hypothetical protein
MVQLASGWHEGNPNHQKNHGLGNSRETKQKKKHQNIEKHLD